MTRKSQYSLLDLTWSRPQTLFVGEEGSGESALVDRKVWAQWNVIMNDDVMLRVTSYGFSDALIASCYSVHSRVCHKLTM